LYWVIFAIGAVLGLFGLIRVFRYLVWMRLVWMSDGASEAIESAIKDFEAGPVVVEESGKRHKIDERAEKLQKGMEKRLERFRRASRWLWPQRTRSVFRAGSLYHSRMPSAASLRTLRKPAAKNLSSQSSKRI